MVLIFKFMICIDDGPSTLGLVEASEYAYDKDVMITATFSLNGGAKINLRVTSLNRENESNDSFEIEGYIVSIYKSTPSGDMLFHDEELRVRVFYNTRTKRGHVHFHSIEALNTCLPLSGRRNRV